jgi:hypothetical protein
VHRDNKHIGIVSFVGPLGLLKPELLGTAGRFRTVIGRYMTQMKVVVCTAHERENLLLLS